MEKSPRLYKPLICLVVTGLLILQTPIPGQADGGGTVFLPYLSNVIHYVLTVTYRSGQSFILWPELANLQGEQPLILPTVDQQAVASVVGDWTGIPVGRGPAGAHGHHPPTTRLATR